MDPNELREHLSPLLDGELTEAERAVVEKELTAHAELLQELEACRRVDTLYRELPAHRAPDGFEEAVQRGIARSRVRLTFGRRLARRPLWPLAAAAAVFAVIIGGVWLLPSQTKRFQTARAPEAPPLVRELGYSQALPHASALRSMPDEDSMPETVLRARPAPAGEEVLSSSAVSIVLDAISDALEEGGAEPGRPAKIVSKGKVEVREGADVALPADRPGVKGQSVLPPPKASNRATSREPKVTRPRAEAAPPTGVAKSAVETMSDQPQASAPSDGALPPPLIVRPPPEKGFGIVARIEGLAGAPIGHTLQGRPEAPDKPRAGASSGVGIGATVRGLVSGARVGEEQQDRPEALEKPPADGSLPRTRAAGRTFELRDGVRRQIGYQGEPVVPLRRGTKAFEGFFAEHADLKPIAKLGDRVVFQHDSRWYRIEPKNGS